jgi:hypothetical protein
VGPMRRGIFTRRLEFIGRVINLGIPKINIFIVLFTLVIVD